MLTATIWFHVCMALVTVAGPCLLYFRPNRTSLRIAEGGFLALWIICAFVLGENRFGDIRLLAYGFFFHLPLFIVLSGLVARHRGLPVSRWVFALAALIALAGLDAFVIEPQWLTVEHVRIHSPKLTAPLTMALLADMQTDHVGDYEIDALRTACAEKPDVILFAGDYLQTFGTDAYLREVRAFNEALRWLPCTPRFGMVAVGGNVDPREWEDIFTGLPQDIMMGTQVQSRRFGEVTITTLSRDDSLNTGLTLPRQEGFEVILGHAPDYSLGRNTADLMLAGHTHGGQVQVPGLGPLITLSSVPRRQASGVTKLPDGRHLLVSSGVGHERGYAPRLRFFCRPQIVMIHLEPEKG